VFTSFLVWDKSGWGLRLRVVLWGLDFGRGKSVYFIAILLGAGLGLSLFNKR
jgi:hypothetical protein